MSARSLLTDQDLHLFNEGTHLRLWERLGAHPEREGSVEGTRFAVWAPNARAVSVVGDWNDWRPKQHALSLRGRSGIWEGFVPGVGRGARYKYHVSSRPGRHRAEKADPFAFHAEVPPSTASIVVRAPPGSAR